MREMISRIPGYSLVGKIITTSTFQQSTITFSGTFINGLLGALFYVFAARFLGSSGFGLLSVAIAALTLVSDVGDLGTDTGLVNFVSRYAKKKPIKSKRFMKLGLEIKLIVSFAVIIIGTLFSNQLSILIFDKVELAPALRIVSLGVGTFLLFSYITHILQALQKFWYWSIIQVGTNSLRLILMLGIIYFGIVNISSTLIVYILMPLLGFVFGILIIKPDFLRVKKESLVLKDFFKYNKWVAAFTLVAAISSRLDVFMSARLLDLSEVGIYSVANQVVSIVPQIVTAIGTVIAPKMAGMGNIRELYSYLKKSILMVGVLCIVGLMSIPLVSFLIPLFYGAEYSMSISIFVVLLLSMLLFLFSTPIHMAIFYYYSYPRLFFWLSFVHFFIISVVGWSMISQHGAMGAAFTVLAGRIVNFVITTYWLAKRVRSDLAKEVLKT